MRAGDARPGFCKLRVVLCAEQARAHSGAPGGRGTPQTPGHELDIRASRAEFDAVRDYLVALREFRRLVTMHYGCNAGAEPRRSGEASTKVAPVCETVRVESAFVFAAASYGRRHGIEYATWREIGVGDDVLREAGICRSG